MRRLGVLLVIGVVVLVAQSAAAQPLAADRCRTLSVLRFKGTLYFHHALRIRRPHLAGRQGVALERACDDMPGEDPPPWVSVSVFALEGIRPAVAVAPRRAQVVFYDPYACSPRLSEARFLRCLRRK
ncbi:MAG TPA: hypothetical protein VJL85_01605 [Gaiellaceae bacterium]|nr:hypothetical protein [Gaiellaceae bacterium]